MRNSLGLDDDLDPVEVVRELERVFDINVTDEEAARVFTVGDFNDLLLVKMPPSTVAYKCASAMAFYRLRKSLRDLGYGTDWKPSSDLRFLERSNVKLAFKKIEQLSGLNLPKVAYTAFGCIAAFALFLATPVTLYLVFPRPVSVIFGLLVGFFAGISSLRFIDPGNLPPNCVTLADLARLTAAQSFSRLAKLGARQTEQDIWNNLVEALSCYSLPRTEITRGTFFLKSQLEKLHY